MQCVFCSALCQTHCEPQTLIFDYVFFLQLPTPLASQFTACSKFLFSIALCKLVFESAK